jgi:hypothetical protein
MLERPEPTFFEEVNSLVKTAIQDAHPPTSFADWTAWVYWPKPIDPKTKNSPASTEVEW